MCKDTEFPLIRRCLPAPVCKYFYKGGGEVVRPRPSLEVAEGCLLSVYRGSI